MRGLAGRKQAREFAQSLSYSKEGLLPVVAADCLTNETLMLAYASPEAVMRTLASGEAWFFSRSRNALWKKGESSGNSMRVLTVSADCDCDALLYLVEVKGKGNACHTGRKSCFARKFGKRENRFSLPELDAIIAQRIAEKSPRSYTAKLAGSSALSASKLREECEELIEALGSKDKKEVAWEACDLLYHALVAVRARGVGLDGLERELARRRGKTNR
jgi:phosphoribosyl-ATP pyrophosphohydrolase/phosphoribosyl-AMP cyclohydrolase